MEPEGTLLLSQEPAIFSCKFDLLYLEAWSRKEKESPTKQ
jgi:hypothetical protein